MRRWEFFTEYDLSVLNVARRRVKGDGFPEVQKKLAHALCGAPSGAGVFPTKEPRELRR